MDEAKLIEKLRQLEALFAGGTTPGERDAADRARQRILDRLRELEQQDPPVEYKFTLDSQYSRRLLVTLLRRYGITPYRYKRQRYTTVMARVSRRFVDETLWPQFERYDEMLEMHLAEVTERVVAEVLQTAVSEPDVVDEPRQLSLGESQRPDRPPSAAAAAPLADAARLPPRPGPATGRPGKLGATDKVGRNAPCPCGSGKKYKRCCGNAA